MFSEFKNMAANQMGNVASTGKDFKDKAGEQLKDKAKEVKSSLQGCEYGLVVGGRQCNGIYDQVRRN